ncbi:uncharacterized protein JCM10292_005656 [Rhodotorula paludigena]|uniref:uncharacterized protein n=1 Tax=Rhodotorula paludigena TaxID=86838 RepID=UPI00316EE62A
MTPALPVELVHHICTLALASSPSPRLHRPTAAHPARYALLGPFSRVSHTWRAATLPLLYRHVALATAARLDAFVDSLEKTDGAQHVRTLRIDGAALQGWECILSICPRLNTLVVAGTDEAAIAPLPEGITRLTYLRPAPLDPLAFYSLHLTHLTLTLPAFAALLCTLSTTSSTDGATPAAAAAVVALLRPVRFLLLVGDWPPGPRSALPALAAPLPLLLLLPSLVALGASIPALPLVRALHPPAARIAWHVPWQPFVDYLSPWRAFPSSPRRGGGIETLVLEPLGFDPPGHFWDET